MGSKSFLSVAITAPLGIGISVDDLQTHLGQFNATSNYCDETTYGCRGEALASISILSFLSIVSRCVSSPAFKTTFGEDAVVCEESVRRSIGTSVSANSIFHSLTVRQKSMKPLAEIIKIKDFVKNMSLLHYGVQFTVIDVTSAGRGTELLRFPSQQSVAARFSHCHSNAQLSKLMVRRYILVCILVVLIS